MDAKRRAQMAWAALLALLALLFIPSTTGWESGSESPSSDPAPDDSGQDNHWNDDQEQSDQTGQGDGATDGSEDTSGDGAGDGGWYEDDDNTGYQDAPSGTPNSGGHAPGPQPDNDGAWSGSGAGLIDDILNEYPSVDAAPSWLTPFLEDNQSSDGGEDSGTGDETVYGDDSPASGYPGHYGGQDSDNAAGVDIPGFSRESALQGNVNLTWAGELAEDAIEWAGDNPEQALVISGAAALTGGAAYVGYSATTGTAMALSASEASSLAAVGVPMTAAANLPSEFRDKLESVANVDDSRQGSTGGSNGGSSGGAQEDTSGGSSDQDTNNGQMWDGVGTGNSGDETAPATPGTGGHVADPGGPTFDPSDSEGSDSGSSDSGSTDPWDGQDDSVGDTTGPVATPGSGGHVANPSSGGVW